MHHGIVNERLEATVSLNALGAGGANLIIDFVIDTGCTAQETDRVRAARRAEIFSRAIEIEALPYAVGEQEEPPGEAGSRVTFVESPAEFPPVL